jgi:hypothetical protein
MVSITDVLIVGVVAWWFFGGSSVLGTVVGGTTRYDLGTGYEDAFKSAVCSGQITTRQQWLDFTSAKAGNTSEDYNQVSNMSEQMASVFLQQIRQQKC